MFKFLFVSLVISLCLYQVNGSMKISSDAECADELASQCGNCGEGRANTEFGPPCVCDYTGCNNASGK